MVQRVADGLGQRTTGRQPGQLGFEPGAQIRHQRLALGLSHDQPISRALAADPRLNLVRARPGIRSAQDYQMVSKELTYATARERILD
jgi:hypothetical protein